MVFWYFPTAFLQEPLHAGSEDRRSTEMILHRAGGATQGGFSLRSHLTLYAREASVAPATQFKRHYHTLRGGRRQEPGPSGTSPVTSGISEQFTNRAPHSAGGRGYAPGPDAHESVVRHDR